MAARPDKADLQASEQWEGPKVRTALNFLWDCIRFPAIILAGLCLLAVLGTLYLWDRAHGFKPEGEND